MISPGMQPSGIRNFSQCDLGVGDDVSPRTVKDNSDARDG